MTRPLVQFAIRDFEWDRLRNVLYASAKKMFNGNICPNEFEVQGDTRSVVYLWRKTLGDHHLYVPKVRERHHSTPDIELTF